MNGCMKAYCRMRKHSILGCVFGLFLCIFNGQYYMQQVLLVAVRSNAY